MLLKNSQSLFVLLALPQALVTGWFSHLLPITASRGMLSDTLEKMLKKPDSFFLKEKVLWGVLISARSSPCVRVSFQDCAGLLKDGELRPLHLETVL